MTSWRKYVLFFAQEHVDFRGAEIKSLTHKFNIPIKYSVNHNEKQPFWLVGLPDDISARELASRSLSLRCILEFRVNLKNPDVNWWYIEYYGLDNMSVPEEPSDTHEMRLCFDVSKLIWKTTIYGIREAIERVERKEHLKPNTITENDVHYPSTSTYNLSDLYENLLSFSARHLKIGGRLVCWLPILKNDYCEGYLPRHNSLQLVANSEQDISAISSRGLLTYEKVSEPCDQPEETNNTEIIAEFRNKFFTYGEETREERRWKQAELRAHGKRMAM